MQNDNFDTCPALGVNRHVENISTISTTFTFVDLSASLEVIGGDVCRQGR
jgi:hypothetical protein